MAPVAIRLGLALFATTQIDLATFRGLPNDWLQIGDRMGSITHWLLFAYSAATPSIAPTGPYLSLIRGFLHDDRIRHYYIYTRKNG